MIKSGRMPNTPMTIRAGRVRKRLRRVICRSSAVAAAIASAMSVSQDLRQALRDDDAGAAADCEGLARFAPVLLPDDEGWAVIELEVIMRVRAEIDDVFDRPLQG